ncbi:glycosyl transferase [Cellulomonas sp. WB94]|uniref:transglycosylase domain-containing protein n=1 Tax=Cellulomonas sp. WB94 TaxID=2173174 RepID=UPI000D578245|nr:transglycosylase domain-containing protein [Cellulomonas sp. WB94]PVU82981.1 glycosyl transferase [Cellulomonas sp. WB94]
MAGTNRRAAQPARRSASRAAATPKRPRRFFDYPRHGYHGLHRWLPSWRFLVGTFLTVCFLGLGAVVAAYALTPIPDPADDTAKQVTTVYYANNPDGSRGEVMGTFAVQRREIVDFATLPAYVGNAVVAGEDRTFWKNSGVSITGTARAFLNNIRGGATQGGSTLTQQYAERYYTSGTTKDYIGKAKEAMLAIKISRAQDKKDILGNYLNTIYFGRDSYGIQVAATSYFGVAAKDLTIPQAALLAAIIPSPNNWDPAKNPDKALAKWKVVLEHMLADGHITQAEYDATLAGGLPPTAEYKRSDTMKGVNGYILERVRSELITSGAFKDEDLDTKGLTIITTIEKPVQDEAVRAVGGLLDGTLAGAQPNPKLRVAVVSIRPQTGAIVSMYGGPDLLTDAANTVTFDAIQAGSTFKPFALIAALQEGVPLTTTFNGKSPQTFGDWPVGNFSNDQFGNIDLVKATEQSVNTVYAQLNLQIGPEKTKAVAEAAGVTTTVDGNRANVLGTDSVHPLDMASAYATIAAQGTYSTPFIVSEVRYLRDDSVAYKGEKAHEQRFAPDVMADATFAMQQVVQNGSAKQWVKPLGRPIAGKTGTNQTSQSAWFVGFTPEISTAVALSQVGGDSGHDPVTIEAFGKSGGRAVKTVTGGTWPAALWASYMKPVLAMAPYSNETPFPARANVGKAPTATATPTPTATTPPVETQAPVTQVAVPSGLEGKLQSDAEAAVLNAGLQPAVAKASSETVPAGKVIRADPAAGTMLDPQGVVTLVVSTGPAPVATPAPTVAPPAPAQTPSPTAAAAG